MLAFLISYILAIIITNFVIYKHKYDYKPFPKLKLTKFGIEFFSTKMHRVKTTSKVVRIDKSVYVNYGDQVVQFNNIKNIILKNEHMFFTACGEVKIFFNVTPFYKYFNLVINSKGIDFPLLKQSAILDLINNNFKIEESKKFNKFLNFLKNILKIQINDEKISVFPNNLKISYQLTYKTNGKIKKINVSNTIGKN